MSVYLNYTTKEARVLTQEEIDTIKEVFVLFDKHGDDTITVDELGMIMRALGQIPTEAELRDIIGEIDADGNKVVEFPEFVDLMARMPPGRLGSRDELTDAIKFTLDAEKDGRMSVEEFRRYMTTTGEPLTDDQVNEMMKYMTIDGDGKLHYEHITELLMERTSTPPPRVNNIYN